MRKTIQTPHGVIKLEYEGGGVYRATLPWFPGRDYVVFHDRQQTQFKVLARDGKGRAAIGFGKDLDESCEIIRAHTYYKELKERGTDALDYDYCSMAEGSNQPPVPSKVFIQAPQIQ